MNIEPKFRQCVDAIFMVRPAAFGFNPDAAESNLFMQNDDVSPEEVRISAIKEFDCLVETLKAAGVNVLVFQDTLQPHTPDSIFPNNWFDSDRDGMCIMYPMCPQSRRFEHEKGRTYLKALQTDHGFRLNKIVDLTPLEAQGKFLEGTGSMVYDCANRVAYACLSPRTNPEILKEFEQITGYRVVHFTAQDDKGAEIYHTNVMMSVGDRFAVVCAEVIANEEERKLVLNTLAETGHEVVEISLEQMNHFAGNVLQILNTDGDSLLAMSDSAKNAFTPEQIAILEKYTRLVSSPIPTIEKYGGGSVRCMMAEVFLPKA